MYQEATVVKRPFEYDVPADNGNMRFGVKAHHIIELASVACRKLIKHGVTT